MKSNNNNSNNNNNTYEIKLVNHNYTPWYKSPDHRP